MNYIVLANAALSLLEALLPQIQQLVKSGDVSPAEQQAVHDRYQALRTAGDAAFQGPEWEIQR
jgi:hypothetical protein